MLRLAWAVVIVLIFICSIIGSCLDTLLNGGKGALRYIKYLKSS